MHDMLTALKQHVSCFFLSAYRQQRKHILMAAHVYYRDINMTIQYNICPVTMSGVCNVLLQMICPTEILNNYRHDNFNYMQYLHFCMLHFSLKMYEDSVFTLTNIGIRYNEHCGQIDWSKRDASANSFVEKCHDATLSMFSEGCLAWTAFQMPDVSTAREWCSLVVNVIHQVFEVPQYFLNDLKLRMSPKFVIVDRYTGVTRQMNDKEFAENAWPIYMKGRPTQNCAPSSFPDIPSSDIERVTHAIKCVEGFVERATCTFHVDINLHETIHRYYKDTGSKEVHSAVCAYNFFDNANAWIYNKSNFQALLKQLEAKIQRNHWNTQIAEAMKVRDKMSRPKDDGKAIFDKFSVQNQLSPKNTILRALTDGINKTNTILKCEYLLDETGCWLMKNTQGHSVKQRISDPLALEDSTVDFFKFRFLLNLCLSELKWYEKVTTHIESKSTIKDRNDVTIREANQVSSTEWMSKGTTDDDHCDRFADDKILKTYCEGKYIERHDKQSRFVHLP